MRPFYLLVTCFVLSALSAQPVIHSHLLGKVIDISTGKGIPLANIFINDTTGVPCDFDGSYVLVLPNGNYTARVSAIGYVTKRVQIAKTTEAYEVNFSLEPDNKTLGVVVVSAGRYEQKIEDITVSMNVLQPELIQNKSVTTMQDAIDQTPGVIVVDNDPQIRSSSGYSFGAGSRVMILVDGLPVLSGDVGRPAWSFLPIENVEQVEVIKGASSVLYGSAAISGVINVRTAYPKDEPQTRVSMLGGTRSAGGQEGTKWWDENRPTFSGLDFFHSRKIKNLDFVVGGNWYSNTGYIGPEPVSADSLAADPLLLGPGGYEHRVRINTGFRWNNQKKEGLSYGFNTNVMDSKNSSVLAWNNVEDGLYRPFPGTVSRTHSTHAYIDPFVNYYGAKGTRHTLRTRLYHVNNRNDGEQSNLSNVLYGEYQIQKDINFLGANTLTAGIMASLTDASSELYAGDSLGTGESDASNQTLYVQIDRKLQKDKLKLNLGMRYERFTVNEDEESVPVFRAGANYQLHKATFLRGSFGQGFRFPTIGERFIQTSVGTLNIYPSTQLVPERSWNLEFGLKQGFKIGGFKGYMDAVWFNQYFTDYIEFTFGRWAPSEGAANLFGLGFRSLNTGEARVSGYEFEVAGQGKIGDWDIMLLAGYTHTDPIALSPDEVYAESAPSDPPQTQFPASTYNSTSSNTEGNILKYRVQDLLRFDVQLNKAKWGLGLSSRYNSHVRNIDLAFVTLDESGLFNTGVSEWMDTHTTGDLLFDARVSRDLSDHIKLAFVVDNLTNEVYSVRPLYIEAPRTFTFRLTYTR